MPNNIEFILAAADLINAAGDCIEKDTPYNDDLIGALANMQVLLVRFQANLNAQYWLTNFNRRVCEKLNLDNAIEEDDDDP